MSRMNIVLFNGCSGCECWLFQNLVCSMRLILLTHTSTIPARHSLPYLGLHPDSWPLVRRYTNFFVTWAHPSTFYTVAACH
jgi:hypothetical protein